VCRFRVQINCLYYLSCNGFTFRNYFLKLLYSAITVDTIPNLELIPGSRMEQDW
jgi:hypothetical protein